AARTRGDGTDSARFPLQRAQESLRRSHCRRLQWYGRSVTGRALGTPGGGGDGFPAKYQDHYARGPGPGRVLFENRARRRTQTTPARKPKPEAGKLQFRIGYGWDSHEFKRGIPLRIGGVTLPHSKGLGG